MSTRYAFQHHRNSAVLAGSILMFIIFSFPLQDTNGQYSETLYGPEEGLSHNSVTGIATDENGFLWVAGVYGICRFDGYRFKEYEYEVNGTRRKFSYYPRFMKDSQGRIWVGHNGPSLLRYNKLTDRLDAVVPAGNMHFWCDLTDDGNGEYSITGQNEFKQLNETGDRNYSMKEYEMPEETGQFVYMHRYEDGTLIVTAQNGLFRVVPGQDSLDVREIKIEGPGAESEPAIDYYTRFLIVGERVYLHKHYEILRTNLPVSGSFTDSVVYTEPVELEFPHIDLHQEERIFSAVPGGKDEILLRSMNGIYRYHVRDHIAERIKIESYASMDAMEGDFREVMYYDPGGILWAGTDQGLLKIVFGNKPFHILMPEPGNPEGISVGKLNQVLVDHAGYIWVGTASDGLYQLEADDGNLRVINHFLPDPDDPASIHSDGVGYLFEDSKNRLWVRSENLQWMDLDDEIGVFHYTLASTYAMQLGTRVVPVNMVEDPAGNLMVAVRGWHPSWLILASGEEAYALFYDSAGLLMSEPYFCKTRNEKFYFFDRSCLFEMEPEWVLNDEKDLLSLINAPPGRQDSNRLLIPWAYPVKTDTLLDLVSLSADLTETFVITEQSGDKVAWLDLFYDARKIISVNLDSLNNSKGSSTGNISSFIRLFSDEKGIDDPFLYEMVESTNGQLWASTRDGLLLIDPSTDNCFKFYTDDGLPSNKFYWGADVGEDGMVYLCTSNGLFYFNPDSISPDPPPRVVLTDLEYFHSIMQPDPESFLKESVTCSGGLTLNHDQNFIGIRFSTLEHRNTSRIEYRYRLEGLDRDWIVADDRRLAEYPNLKPGRYTFRLIAANGNGVWNLEGISLDIRVLRPFWFRWWAIVLEFILLLSLLILYINYRERNLKRRAILLEQQVNEKTHEILEQRKEVDELKSRFYTNISHEFRTPLTLLMGPLEDTLKTTGEEVRMRKGVLRIMLRNARRLLHLINQLLDISKFESGKMMLQLGRGDLGEFVQAISSAFLSRAESRRIEFHIDVQKGPGEVFFDHDKTEKVISNLLSNAFKFTPDGGKISIRLSFNDAAGNDLQLEAVLEITDNGKGIGEEHLERIFDRFYQVSDSDTREEEGTGIGLALTKEMVQLMHGQISVESKLGEGTKFRVTFPVSGESISADERIELLVERYPLSGSEISDMDHSIELVSDSDQKNMDRKEELILIVEDHPELKSYIRAQLVPYYRIAEAKNGKEGLETALKLIPDLVITDLMMPVMGGTEMCEKLKKHPATNHIPVIMLTAKADMDSKLKGLETGADDYIIKPFNALELTTRARNLIRQREILRQRFQKSYFLEEYGNENSVHFKMLRLLVSVIDRHLDDPEFDLAVFGQELKVSRSQLYRKIRGVTGTTPKELIRMVRMKRAARMIRTGELNVTQVMYRVGLKNPSYFASLFRKYYGVNPSAFNKK